MSVSTLANCKMRCCGLTIDTIWRRFSGLSWGRSGPLTLIAYSVLRAAQTWLARYQTPHHRLQSGIDGILHIVDWLPVRLVVVYASVGHGESAPGVVCFAGRPPFVAVSGVDPPAQYSRPVSRTWIK